MIELAYFRLKSKDLKEKTKWAEDRPGICLLPMEEEKMTIVTIFLWD